MQYRKFGKTGWDVSALGFGCMRLPTTDGNIIGPNIDEPQAIEIIRRGIDLGINYVDTAYSYHVGNSERVLGKALEGGYRDRVKLVTKSPVFLLQDKSDFDRFLAEQMERLRVEHIDLYLLHALSASRWKTVTELDVLASAEAAIHDGRIGRLGFSFHDDTGAFKAIVDGYDGWAACLIQHNYMDTANQAGTEGLRYAAARGVPVAIMEPLLGGCLARPPAEAQAVFDGARGDWTPADWALQWLWDQPEVSIVLSGMSSAEQVEANVRAAGESGIGSFTPEDHAVIDRAREAFRGRMPVPCTRCGYCMPCPNGVNIPSNIDLYNDTVMYGNSNGPRFRYAMWLAAGERASVCEACGECEEKCPQDITVGEWMPKIHQALG
ncbi:MAG TPA: aldo/keto reductase [Candidatus Anoxymicrobiaceae bacterium]